MKTTWMSWSSKQVGGPCFAHSTESSVWFLRAWIELLPEAGILQGGKFFFEHEFLYKI